MISLLYVCVVCVHIVEHRERDRQDMHGAKEMYPSQKSACGEREREKEERGDTDGPDTRRRKGINRRRKGLYVKK